jgi:hypothetical protein
VPPEPVYRADPHAAPDEAYEPGRLAHLVAGNRARLLDERRTPVSLAGVDPERGMFALLVEGFEDAGARWELPLEEVSRVQFEPGGRLLDGGELERLAAVRERLDQPYAVPATAQARAQTERELASERGLLRERLAGRPALAAIDLDACVAARRGSDAAQDELERIMRERGLAELERAFAQSYVSNPGSGEIVKGHAIVLAEMGLCPFSGKLVRDPCLFEGDGARERRQAHILVRLAFLAELTSMLGQPELELYRAVAGEAEPEPARPASLLAASFSREVAMAHFDGGPKTRFALLMRQRVPAGRLFMSFLETAAMNARYAEAEAVLIGEPDAALF